MYRKSIPIKRTNSYAYTTHRTKVIAEKLKFSSATYGFKITMFIYDHYDYDKKPYLI